MAGEAAVALAAGTAIDALPGVQKFKEGKKGIEMNSILLPPNPITKDNLGDVISAGWIHQGRGLRRRRGGFGCCLQLIRCQTI